MDRLWPGIAVTALACVACETSVFHKIPNRQRPTDTGCTPNQLPSDLRALVFPSRVELRWADNSTNEDGYIVDRRNARGAGGPIIQLGPNASSYQDSAVEPDIEYHYRVRGYRVEGEQQCETRDAGPMVVHSQPRPPEDPDTANPSSNAEVVLTWTDSNNLETAYVVQRLDDADGIFVEVGTVSPQAGTGSSMTLVDTGLTPATAYEYRIYTTNKDAASTPAGILARTANPPETNWTGDPYLTDTCELVIPGGASFDDGMQASYASAQSTISHATTTDANADGVRASLTDLTPGVIDINWTVIDSLSGQSEPLTRPLNLIATTTTRTMERRPALTIEDQSSTGHQALLPGCSTCTGRGGAIATGLEHTCLLNDGGQVECWGLNDNGQVGSGRADRHANPVRPCSDTNSEVCWDPLDGVVDVSTWDTTCVVSNTGEVFCWGNNYDGNLGAGYSASALPASHWPTPVCLSGFAFDDDCDPLVGASVHGDAIAVGDNHACVILATGNVMCWGDGGSGALGNGLTDDQTWPTLVCASGDWDGVACSGGAPLNDVVAIVAGEHHTCAIVDDGSDRTAKCWGDNGYGQIGDGTGGSGTDWLRPQDVCATGTSAGTCTPLTNVQSLSLGFDHSCALLAAGDVVCWGRNYSGQLGIGRNDGSSTRYPNPIPVCANGEWDGSTCDDDGAHAPLHNAIAVAALAESTCALLANGEVHCWGDNGNGELGDGTKSWRFLPGPVCASGSAADDNCLPLSGIVGLAAGPASVCATLPGGALACWGGNGYGELGSGVVAGDEVNPKAVCAIGSGDTCERLFGATTVAVGNGYTCATDRVGGLGTGGIHCWGYNGGGQLGRGYGDELVLPQTVCTSGSLFDCVPLEGVVALDAGFHHTCALRDDGTVYCWGDNMSSWGVYSGQLGIGSSHSSSANAVPVCAHGDWNGVACERGPLTGVVGITTGAYHTCALLETGVPMCWGLNNCGQLGNGDFGDCVDTDDFFPLVHEPSPVCADGSAPPLCVPLNDIVQINSYFLHTCATRSDGEVLCWGTNSSGQIGSGTSGGFAASPTPVCASGAGADCRRLDDALTVAVGRTHSCALLASGEATCWGENYWGQLGSGWTPDRPNPSPVCAFGSGASCVRLQSIVSLSLGHETTCAVLEDGGSRCWGYAEWGVLGAGSGGWMAAAQAHPLSVCAPDVDATCHDEPVCSGPLTNATAISTSPYHACALLDDGTAVCWGQNMSNRLGNGGVTSNWSADPACVPVPVCEWGLGREACDWGEILQGLAVATCDVLAVELP